MPLPLIAIILGAVAALAVVVLAIIYYDDIVKWFRARNDIKVADKDNIAFTIKQRLENGDYKVVQGIFNKRTDDLVEGHAMQSEKLDEELERQHESNELVIYE
jgi:hypothetical protein